MKADQTWLHTRQQLLQRLKAQVALRLGPPSRELKLYTRQFHKQFPKRWRSSSKRQLLARIGEADFVFGSDFHAFSQAQRLHLRLLRELIHERPIVLCCEFLEVKHQKWVDQLQSGQIGEDEFLRKSQWQRRWGFPWESYRSLLEFAREEGIEVLALNHIGHHYGLKKRDQMAALRLADHFKSDPKSLHYVVFGELHLAPQHLPRQLLAQFKSHQIKSVFIYQDEEDIYFRLAGQGREGQVDVLEAAENRFCVLGAPPWVKWQSYAMYLESTFDRDLDDGDVPLELGDQVKAMVQLLARDLDVEVKGAMTVYSSRQAQLWRDLKRNLRPVDLKTARQMVERDRSFYLPVGQIGYVARASVNHVADIAGRYIHAGLSKQKAPTWRMPRHFSALIWIEAVGFFASKLVNHKRAADTLTDLRAQIGTLRAGDEGTRDVLALALDQRTHEVFFTRGVKRKTHRRFRPRRKESYFEAARLLGAMMGERLYQSFRQHWLSKQTLLSWMRQDVACLEFAAVYMEIVRKLEPGEKLGKTRSERL